MIPEPQKTKSIEEREAHFAKPNPGPLLIERIVVGIDSPNDDGKDFKYTVVWEHWVNPGPTPETRNVGLAETKFFALRYGEPWIDDLYGILGGKMWLCAFFEMAQMHEDLAVSVRSVVSPEEVRDVIWNELCPGIRMTSEDGQRYLAAGEAVVNLIDERRRKQ